MRSFDGQRSDNRPTRRSPEEKRKQLQIQKQRLATMKPYETPALRAALQASIAELERELAEKR